MFEHTGKYIIIGGVKKIDINIIMDFSTLIFNDFCNFVIITSDINL